MIQVSLSKIFTFSDPRRASVTESYCETSAQVYGPVHSQEVRGFWVSSNGDLLDVTTHDLPRHKDRN